MTTRTIVLAVLLTGCEALTGGGEAPEAPVLEKNPAEVVEGAAAEAEAAPAEAPEAAARVNLNTATEEQLKQIPGITPKLVHEFEEYRPYVSVAQFRKEIGKYADEATVAAFEPHVYVPVDPAASDAVTLQQLGLTEEQAAAVIEQRPFGDRAAFLAALGEHLSEAQVETAKGLLKAE